MEMEHSWLLTQWDLIFFTNSPTFCNNEWHMYACPFCSERRVEGQDDQTEVTESKISAQDDNIGKGEGCVVMYETLRNEWVCHPGGHCWDYRPGALSLGEVTATYLKIGHPSVGARSSDELQWLWLKDSSPSNSHQGDMPHCNVVLAY